MYCSYHVADSKVQQAFRWQYDIVNWPTFQHCQAILRQYSLCVKTGASSRVAKKKKTFPCQRHYECPSVMTKNWQQFKLCLKRKWISSSIQYVLQFLFCLYRRQQLRSKNQNIFNCFYFLKEEESKFPIIWFLLASYSLSINFQKFYFIFFSTLFFYFTFFVSWPHQIVGQFRSDKFDRIFQQLKESKMKKWLNRVER